MGTETAVDQGHPAAAYAKEWNVPQAFGSYQAMLDSNAVTAVSRETCMKELYLGDVEDMPAAILDGAAPYLSLTETRHHVQTVLALYESARNGRVVPHDHITT